MILNKKSKIYLDYAATTPMDKEVLKAMAPYFCGKFGNSSSLHFFGQEALAAVDKSREKIAKAINADFREVIFTGSATEANNLALRGVVKFFDSHRAIAFQNQNNFFPVRIIVSAIEHSSILETCRDLEREGIEIIYLPVNKQGIVDLKKLKESLNEQTILVSIMYANNEIGVIQPIAKIAEIINKFKSDKKISSPKPKRKRSPASRGVSGLREENFFSDYPLFHTDAVQAFQFLNCNVKNLGVDLMILSAHKIYGPKGIGALYINSKSQTINPKPYTLNPIITGGGQEFGLRSGTENVPAIIGFAKAVELVEKNRAKEFKRIAELSNYFWKEIKKIYPKAEINGIENKIPNILNINFPNQNAEELLMKLDLNGIAVSSGSACSARAVKLSYTLKAIGLPDAKIKNSLRFSFGKFTTKEEIKKTIEIIKNNK